MLFKKFRNAIEACKSEPRLILGFSLFVKKTLKYARNNDRKAMKFRSRRLKAKVFQYLKSLKHSPESHDEQMQRANIIYRLTIIQRAFNALKMNRKHETNYKEFIVKRYRDILKTILIKWHQIRTRKNRNLTLEEQAVLLSKRKLLKNTFDTLLYNWMEAMNTRTKQRFFNYWIRVHTKAVKDVESFSTGCRKRHLTSYYFKMFKKTTKIMINKKKIKGLLLKRAFNNFKLAVGVSKCNKLAKKKAVQHRNNTYDKKLVKYT